LVWLSALTAHPGYRYYAISLFATVLLQVPQAHLGAGCISPANIIFHFVTALLQVP